MQVIWGVYRHFLTEINKENMFNVLMNVDYFVKYATQKHKMDRNLKNKVLKKRNYKYISRRKVN